MGYKTETFWDDAYNEKLIDFLNTNYISPKDIIDINHEHDPGYNRKTTLIWFDRSEEE